MFEVLDASGPNHKVIGFVGRGDSDKFKVTVGSLLIERNGKSFKIIGYDGTEKGYLYLACEKIEKAKSFIEFVL